MNLRNRLFLAGAVLAAGALGFAASKVAQDMPGMPTPGPEHKWLQSHVGEWDATVNVMGQATPGTNSYHAGPGGLWLIGDFKGDMMGMPFTGHELTSYDAKKKKYISVWIDSMTTDPMILEGTYDRESKKLTMTGEGPGMTGEKVRYTNVTEYKDDNTMRFTMSQPGPDGKDMEMMSIDYKRKK